MTGPSPGRVFADYFDGETGLVHRAEIFPEGDDLVLALPERDPVRWPFESLRSIPDQADDRTLVVTSTNRPLARLNVRDEGARREIARRAPRLAERPPVRGRGRVAAWAGAAVASVALIIFVLVPVMADQLARFLPPEGEKALGDATFEQIRDVLSEDDAPLRFCDGDEGLRALEVMEDRLAGALDLPYPLTVAVLDHEMVNAFALPGGYVVFFRGLIDAADDPDEVAAVFAHELGHVVARDPARIALRSAGSIGVLGLLLGDFAGGAAVLFLVEWIIQADYSREAEAAADDFALGLMREAGIDPAALARFFARLRDQYGDAEGIVAHLLSHPSLGDRIARAEAAGQGMETPRPSLGPGDWDALRRICD